MSVRETMRVSDLSYAYGSTEVWKDVSFDISEREIVYLVGENGSGKSTLLRCLAAQSKPQDGTITLLDETFPLKDRSLLSQLFLVPDVPSFYDDLTAEEHLEFILKANNRIDEIEKAHFLLEEFGLGASKKRLPSSFSRGMREKLALTIAFTLKPALLLLDEPYGPLDARTSRLLSDLIREYAREGMSVLMSCHQTAPDLTPHKILILDEGYLKEIDEEELEEFWMISASPTVSTFE